MSTFSITIEARNSAFDCADRGPELARILRALADELEESDYLPSYHAALFDANGNKCGLAVLLDT